jgi:hypothetical protein
MDGSPHYRENTREGVFLKMGNSSQRWIVILNKGQFNKGRVFYCFQWEIQLRNTADPYMICVNIMSCWKNE